MLAWSVYNHVIQVLARRGLSFMSSTVVILVKMNLLKHEYLPSLPRIYICGSI